MNDAIDHRDAPPRGHERAGDAARGEGRRHPPTVIGWAVRLVSLALLGLLAGMLAWEASRPERPTALSVEPDWSAARETDAGYLLPVTVVNQGSRPLRELAFTLESDGEPVELEAALLGAGERADYEVAFAHKPTRLAATVRHFEAP